MPAPLPPIGGGRLLHMDAAQAPPLAAAFAAMSPWSDYPYPADALAAYLSKDEPSAPRYLVTVDDVTAGAAGLRLDWLRGPYLQFLGILPAHQCSGLGAAVLGWLERETRASGGRNLWVAASEFNIAARRFYARHGFDAVARLDGLVQDGTAEILMRKPLA